jgi:hypothetical protein
MFYRRAKYLFLLLVLSCGVPALFAQAPIDPNLPEAPVPEDGALFAPGYEVVPMTKTPVAPLSAGQKLRIAADKTFDPAIFLKSAIPTGFDKAAGTGPDYGAGWQSVGKLYAYNTANLASSYMFAGGLIPVVFHQDPRYFRKGNGPIKSRVLYALRSEVVAYSDKGSPMPNYGTLIGLGMSSALSNAYLPAKDVSLRNTMTSYAIRLGVSSGFRVLSEFGGVKGLLNRRQDP